MVGAEKAEGSGVLGHKFDQSPIAAHRSWRRCAGGQLHAEPMRRQLALGHAEDVRDKGSVGGVIRLAVVRLGRTPSAPGRYLLEKQLADLSGATAGVAGAAGDDDIASLGGLCLEGTDLGAAARAKRQQQSKYEMQNGS